MGKKRICLDPGHYGSRYNKGAINGYYESAIVWKLTMYEKEILESMGIEVILTRSNQNKDLDLYSRGMKAKGCDLFVSNHTNACNTPSVTRAVAIYLVDNAKTDIDEKSRAFANMLAPAVDKCMGGIGFKTYSKKSESDRDKNGLKDDNYYGVLHGCFKAGTPGIIMEHGFHTNVCVCKWLMNDTNLRMLAEVCAKQMAAFVGVVEKEKTDKVEQKDAAEVIWNFLKNKGLNDYAIAGFMGNLYAESGLSSINLQNSFERKLDRNDVSYTEDVDSGAYTNFVNDHAGYGLAQWTYHSRKQNLLNHARFSGKSIGDFDMQLDFLWKELSGSYVGLLNILKDVKSVREASTEVLVKFERPADQGKSVQDKRAKYSQTYYDRFTEAVGKEYPSVPFTVTVIYDGLYYCTKPDGETATEKTGKGVFTIVEVSNGWGKLKSGVGWIWLGNPEYCTINDSSKEDQKSDTPFRVKVEIPNLNVRTGAGTNYAKTEEPTGVGIFTIIEVRDGKGSDSGWGRLQSGAGWISLDYATRV